MYKRKEKGTYSTKEGQRQRWTERKGDINDCTKKIPRVAFAQAILYRSILIYVLPQ